MNGIYIISEMILNNKKAFTLVLSIEGRLFQGSYLGSEIDTLNGIEKSTFIPIPKEEVEILKGKLFTSDDVISVIKKYAPEFWL